MCQAVLLLTLIKIFSYLGPAQTNLSLTTLKQEALFSFGQRKNESLKDNGCFAKVLISSKRQSQDLKLRPSHTMVELSDLYTLLPHCASLTPIRADQPVLRRKGSELHLFPSSVSLERCIHFFLHTQTHRILGLEENVEDSCLSAEGLGRILRSPSQEL